MFYQKKTTNNEIKLSDNALKNKIYNNMDITKINSEITNGKYYLTFNIENNTEIDYEVDEKSGHPVYIILYDKNKIELDRKIIVISSIKKGDHIVQYIRLNKKILKGIDSFKLSDY